MIVAVVGGTGTIGRVVVENLERRGHHPRVLSRRPPEHSDRTHHRVDLTTGDGLEEALTGVETVVDASNPGSPTKDAAAAVLLEGTQRLLAAETSTGVSRHVLMSIVGAEAIPFPYHRFKVQQEALVARSGLGWSIVRATQFHQLIDFLFRSTSRWGLLPKAGIPLQPVDPRDVAPVVSSAVENGSSGQRLQIVGPQTLGLAELAEMWRLRNRSLALPLPIPLFGDFGRALKSGELTNTAAPKGLITFSDWLDEHIPSELAPA